MRKLQLVLGVVNVAIFIGNPEHPLLNLFAGALCLMASMHPSPTDKDKQ